MIIILGLALTAALILFFDWFFHGQNSFLGIYLDMQNNKKKLKEYEEEDKKSDKHKPDYLK